MHACMALPGADVDEPHHARTMYCMLVLVLRQQHAVQCSKYYRQYELHVVHVLLCTCMPYSQPSLESYGMLIISSHVRQHRRAALEQAGHVSKQSDWSAGELPTLTMHARRPKHGFQA